MKKDLLKNADEMYCQERVAINGGARLEELRFKKCKRLITGFILYDDMLLRPVCDRCQAHIEKVLGWAVEAKGIPFSFS